jgi:hypothetical protein
MKIQLNKGYVAVLQEENGDIVGVFKDTKDARQVLEQAVAEHFDVVTVGLCDSRDFSQPFEYDEPYEFILYKGMSEDEYVTLRMTFTKIY